MKFKKFFSFMLLSLLLFSSPAFSIDGYPYKPYKVEEPAPDGTVGVWVQFEIDGNQYDERVPLRGEYDALSVHKAIQNRINQRKTELLYKNEANAQIQKLNPFLGQNITYTEDQIQALMDAENNNQ